VVLKVDGHDVYTRLENDNEVVEDAQNDIFVSDLLMYLIKMTLLMKYLV
jgi:hypothetical protein